MIRHILCLVIFLLGSSVAIYAQEGPADVILLKNNDKITGQITKFEGDKVFLKSPVVGEVKVPMKQIQSISSNRNLYFRIEGNNEVVYARPEGAQEGKWVLNSEKLGQLNLDDGKVIMVSEEEKFVDPEQLALEAKLLKWAGFIDLSFSGNEGNKNDVTFDALSHIEATTPGFSFTAEARIKHSSIEDEIVANEASGFIELRKDISERFFVFFRTSALWDEVREIDLEFAVSLGLGYRLFLAGDFTLFDNTDVVTWDIGLAATFSGTYFDDGANEDDINSGGATLNTTYKHIIAKDNPEDLWYKGWIMTITAEYFQSANETDDYRVMAEFRLDIPLNKTFSLSGSLRDTYKNLVAADTERNDIDWRLGLRISF